MKRLSILFIALTLFLTTLVSAQASNKHRVTAAVDDGFSEITNDLANQLGDSSIRNYNFSNYRNYHVDVDLPYDYNYEPLDDEEFKVGETKKLILWDNNNIIGKTGDGTVEQEVDKPSSEQTAAVASAGKGGAVVVFEYRGLSKSPVSSSYVKARARLAAIAGTMPNYLLVSYGLETATTSTGSFKKETSSTYKWQGAELKAGSTTPYTSYSAYATRYWRGFGSFSAYFNVAIVGVFPEDHTRASLLNRKAVEYPKYKDRQSRIELWVPPTNLSPNPRTPSSTYRSNFIKYYEANWGQPTYFTWNDVEIHHMKPVKYNGSDDPSNLIPLWSSTAKNTNRNNILKHSVLNNWWTNY